MQKKPLSEREKRELAERIADVNKRQKELVAAIEARHKALPEVPSSLHGFATRPQAATATQRNKRRNSRDVVGRIEAKVTNGVGEILMFGTIGDDWFGEGITPQSVDSALKEMGDVSEIVVRANSGGGDVFDATAIYHALVTHPAKVRFIVEGVAASAMTLIAMAGDTITISENAHWMIHAASGMAYGNAEELRQYLTLLDNADSAIRLTYAARTGISDAELVAMMSFDNWMTAQEALDNGFVDSIDPVKSKVTPHVEPEQSIVRRPTHLSPERLAAASGYLSALSAIVLPKHPTGSSPQPVTPPKKELEMNKKLRARCVAAGMDEKLTDELANEWFEANEEKVFAVAPVAPVAAPAATPTTVAPVAVVDEDKIVNLIEAREKARAEKVKAWRVEIDETVAMSLGENYPTDLRSTLYDIELGDSKAVRAAIVEAKAKADEAIDDGGVMVTFKSTQPQDRHRAALHDGLMARCLSNFVTHSDVNLSSSERLEKHLPAATRSKDYGDFQHMKLVDIAKESLVAKGISREKVMRLHDWQAAQAALGYYESAGIRAEGAFHTTGSLTQITQDAINKTLLAGYEEAPQTWRGPGRQATSVPDFKTIHRIKLGAAANLPVWPDNTAPNQATLSNEQETYAVEARAETLSFSWQLIINDDLDALSRRPQLLGDAAARTVNAVFWSVVTANAALSDGQAMFLETPAGNRKRSNLTTGTASPTNITIGAMKAKMRLMRGLNTAEGNESEDVLNLTPAYIVGPAALEEVILKQVLSGADPALTGSSAVYNTARQLMPIIEPLLDADSSTAWYLFASPGRVDTIEVTFLSGQETPVTHSFMDDATMSQHTHVIQTYAAKGIDHRGLQRHDGV